MIAIEVTDEDLHSGRHPLVSAMSRAGVRAPHASRFVLSYVGRDGTVRTILVPPAGQQLCTDFEEGNPMKPVALELDIDPADVPV